MARPFPYPITHHIQSLPLSIGIFMSIFALVALCARRGSRSPRCRYDNDAYEQEAAATKRNTTSSPMNHKTPPRSPLANPRKFLSNISNNMKPYSKKNGDDHIIKENDVVVVDQREGFGEGGLWQKEILMGEKCQPLDFSGVIYYDNYGNKVSQPPRSPRASAVSFQGSMPFPVSSRSSSDIN
ncbi:hypothetical protein BVRB_6g141280 [Beta vulgaris subsp. vulgaris]|nr:hypothetical protein BVRB_6g141280 [Beta vulgaris subsp. vulgaris]